VLLQKGGDGMQEAAQRTARWELAAHQVQRLNPVRLCLAGVIPSTVRRTGRRSSATPSFSSVWRNAHQERAGRDGWHPRTPAGSTDRRRAGRRRAVHAAEPHRQRSAGKTRGPLAAIVPNTGTTLLLALIPVARVADMPLNPGAAIYCHGHQPHRTTARAPCRRPFPPRQ
jgi:hypothetical protein